MALQKVQVKIGGMACSFCVETIKKGPGRTEGVAEVNVSLAHEEALIAYDAAKVTPIETHTLRSLGYTVRDPNKVRTFEEEEAGLGHERDRLIVAGATAWAGFMAMLLMWVDVLMEISAFGGLVGGVIGLVNPVFRSYEFFGVAVFVTAYHILRRQDE